jgi:SAM-dependent methyltransferase
VSVAPGTSVPDTAFDSALAGLPAHLLGDDGRVLPVASNRWREPADAEDRWMLDRCGGPTLDLGCGPGRLVIALVESGVPALGVDCSPSAVHQTRSRGGMVLRRDVFDRLPGEGRWHHVLLADGNIGIGGDPAALLRRCAALLRTGGTMLIETAGPGAGLWRGRARLVAGASAGWWFPWAVVGPAELAALAAQAGLWTQDQHRGARWFLELRSCRELRSRPVGVAVTSADGKP